MAKGLPNLNNFNFMSIEDEPFPINENHLKPKEDNNNLLKVKSLSNYYSSSSDEDDRWEEIFKKFLISDDIYETSEVEANGTNSIFIKSKGQRIEISDVFNGEEDYFNQTLKLIKKINENYNSNELPKYIYEGRLKLKNEKGEIVNTARCHIVLPPACDFPQITIAKKTTSLTTLDIIQSSGSMNLKMKEFVKLCLKCNLTTVLSGASGAGKTTFTEAMTKEWPMGIRIGVAEDSPELNL